MVMGRFLLLALGVGHGHGENLDLESARVQGVGSTAPVGVTIS